MKSNSTSKNKFRFAIKCNVGLKLILIVFFIQSLTTEYLFSQQKDFQLGFTFTPHQTCYKIDDTLHCSYWQHYNWFSELKLNLWQGFFAGSDLQYHLTSLDSLERYEMGGYYEPDSLMYAAFGKVSIHQADSVNDRYRYNNHHSRGIDTVDNWQGQTQRVRYYQANPTGPYTAVEILTGLNENAENSYSGVVIDPIYQPVLNDNGVRFVNKYYVKPRMRISTTDAFGIVKPVVKIIMHAFDGSKKDSIIITTTDFRYESINTYDGRYLEEYFNNNLIVRGDSLNVGRVGGFLEWHNIDLCHVDYQIHWFQEVSVWIDYVKIMDEPAEKLFGKDQKLRNTIKIKVDSLLNHDGPIHNVKGFYTEETDYARLTCLNYLQDFLRDSIPGHSNDPRAKMISMFNPWSFEANMRERGPDYDVNTYIDVVNPDALIFGWYPFQGPWGDFKPVIPNNVTIQFINSYTPQFIQDTVTGYYNSIKKPLNAYNDSLQRIWNVMADTLKRMVSIAFLKNLDLHFVSQVHAFKEGPYPAANREPMNSEIGAMNCIGLCYGIKGLMPYAFNTVYSMTNENNETTFNLSIGMVDSIINLTTPGQLWEAKEKRIMNFYGENKWEGVKHLNEKIHIWGPLLANSNNTQGFSVNRDGPDQNFISDIMSIFRDPQSPYGFSPSNNDVTKYWEMGFFYPDYLSTNDKSKYFMMVNKRCVPDMIDKEGDVRQLKIKFDSTDLSGYNNWILSDMNTGISKVFDKRNQGTGGFLDMGSTQGTLGYFLPGEGKLYKLAPVMQEGGTLVADEDCGGFEFECRGEVNNNGHDVSIKPQTTILFANSSSRINMNGGSFHSGSSTESYSLYLKAKAGSNWKGLKLSNCEEAILNRTIFEGVSPYPVDSTYALELTDCGYVTVANCTFASATTGKTGAMLLNYTSQGDPKDIYIYSNIINLNTGSMPAVSIIATGFDELPLLMEWNEFESCSENNTLAILLCNVTGGAIKENNFMGYDRTVFMLGSSIDFYGNSIIGSDQSSVGIVQHSASNANLSASGEMFTGGYNSITAEGQTAKCIQLSNSFLLIDEGYNIFRLEDSQTNNYQLEGTIPNDVGADPYPAENNCFQLGNSLLIKQNLRWIDETAINLDTVPSSCNSERPESFMVFNLGNGINDTVRYESGGSGGGERAIRNYELGIKNYENSISENLKESVSNAEVVSVKALSDSVSINLRKRDYERVSILCSEMLTEYADSINDASLISKLYLTELKQDTSSSMSELKSFLESYILNNPEKEMMIRQAFYFIQKCKVSLGLYESAMTGFQQIINQFPYSYEGLLASWDYAATSLLNSNSGSGAGKNSMHISELTDEEIMSYTDDPNDVYDNRKFSTDDRKTLSENLTKTFSSQVNKQTLEIKSLEEKVTKNEASNSEKKKYQEMRALKEVVKARTPENVAMHVSMISDDLSRIMKSTGAEYSEKYEANILPTEFVLHQNYPNPYNPATKISFDLPQDSKVNLVIYDLLGREVTRLVNYEFKVAGKYTYDFNGASLSSGVYFYRIETGKFSETKRMVLLK